MVLVLLQNTDLKVREDVVRGLYLEGVEEVYVASREVRASPRRHNQRASKMAVVCKPDR